VIIADAKTTQESERIAIKRLTSLIKARDPDVIEGHNLFRFDLPYLVARAKKLKTKLDWAAAPVFCVRARRDFKSRRRRSTIRSLRSTDATSSTLFCSRNSMMSGCARSLVSSGPTSHAILDFVMKKSPRWSGRNWSAPTSAAKRNFAAERFAAFARPARS